MDPLAKKIAARYLKRAATTEGQKDLDWGVKKLDKALDDIEEVLIHWDPKGSTPGLADGHPNVAESASIMRQVGKILGPQVAKLKRMKFGRAKVRGKLLDRKLKNLIAHAFKFEGLDGNKFFRKAQDGYSKALGVLQDYGIEMDEVVSSHLFNPPEGRISINLAWTNKEDMFSPESIPNSMLVVTFHQMESGKFEVIAYLS